ncbi:sugar ABC transporter substrate-binding protein [Ethanoligenens sp.]|uniref:sugar ABC transporter substrate-binding protein n=1 Tax=Ethanoligenens sp. TaxID=2099655 RepID=UPI0039EC29E3
MKKILAALLSVVILVGMTTGCASGGSADKSSKKHYTFGFTAFTMNNPFITYLNTTLKQQIEKNGDKLITTDPAQDPQKQIDQINDLISQNIDALFLCPVDVKGIAPALAALKAAKIPVINYDTAVSDLSSVDTYITTDNFKAGQEVGEDMVKRFPQGGDIIVLDTPTLEAVTNRINGVKDAIKGHNFKIVAEQNGQCNIQTAMQVTQDILQQHSDAVAIVGGNDPMALGALSAVKAANATKPVIYGIDGSPDAKQQIAAGSQIVGTAAQSPKNEALTCAETAYKILKGQAFEKRINIAPTLINKDNLSQFGTNSWQ